MSIGLSRHIDDGISRKGRLTGGGSAFSLYQGGVLPAVRPGELRGSRNRLLLCPRDRIYCITEKVA